MKKYILTTLFLSLFSFIALGQDLIIKKNGEDIRAKVIEITLSEVKYKKFENIDGPIYTLLIKDILLIKYENGSKDLFNGSKIKIIDTNKVKYFSPKNRVLNLFEISSFYNSERGIFKDEYFDPFNRQYSYKNYYTSPISFKFIKGYKFNEQFALGLGVEYTKIDLFNFFTLSSEFFCYTSKNRSSPFINLNYGVFQFERHGISINAPYNYSFAGKIGYKFSLNKGALQLGFGFKQLTPESYINFIPSNGYFTPSLSYLF